MNDYFLAVTLGLIEGVTEFLPVSSTAHLRISEALLGIDLSNGFWKMFSIVIQLGAILCLPIYFRKRIQGLLLSFPNGTRGDRTPFTHPLTLVIIAFLCTAAPSFLLTKMIGKNLESLSVMGVALLAGGIAMWVIDGLYQAGTLSRPGDRTEDLEDMGLRQAVWIGLCQTLSALFPGTSRSMATIAAGQVAQLSRPAALEFSFLVSIPTMAAATLYDLLKSIKAGKGATDASVGALHLASHEWMLLLVGAGVSFVVAYAVVAWFMGWVRQRGFVPFAVYRILAGVAVLVFAARVAS